MQWLRSRNIRIKRILFLMGERGNTYSNQIGYEPQP